MGQVSYAGMSFDLTPVRLWISDGAEECVGGKLTGDFTVIKSLIHTHVEPHMSVNLRLYTFVR